MLELSLQGFMAAVIKMLQHALFIMVFFDLSVTKGNTLKSCAMIVGMSML
jgi:hypothetical protein